MSKTGMEVGRGGGRVVGHHSQIALRGHSTALADGDAARISGHTDLQPAHDADANEIAAGKPVLLVEELKQVVQMVVR